MSVSRYFAELLQRDLDSPEGYDDAMKSYLSGLSRDFFDSDPSIPYPTKDEIHDRTGLR